MITGYGKFAHFERTVSYFSTLGLAFPEVNVVFAAATELFGGICLFLVLEVE